MTEEWVSSGKEAIEIGWQHFLKTLIPSVLSNRVCIEVMHHSVIG